MTSKERVLKTLAHEEPDRVPIGEWGIDHDDDAGSRRDEEVGRADD